MPALPDRGRVLVVPGKSSQELQLDTLQGDAGGMMEQAVVAGASEPSWQDVLKDAEEEGGSRERAVAHPAGFGLPVAEGDAAVALMEDVVLGDDAAVEVASKILERFAARSDEGDVDHPFGWREWEGEPEVGQPLQQPGAKDFGEVLTLEEVFALAPDSTFGADDGGRDEHVDVGVECLVARMGMEDGGDAEGSLNPRIVAGEGLRGTDGLAEHGVVDEALMVVGDAAQFGGQGCGEKKVVCGKQLAGLSGEPLLGQVMLTPRTGAMAAGDGDLDAAAAIAARRDDNLIGRFAAAVLDGVEGSQLAGKEAVAELRDEAIAMAIDQFGEIHGKIRSPSCWAI